MVNSEPTRQTFERRMDKVIRSHRSISSARNAKDTWQIYHNALTDKAARVGANPLPDWIQPVWEQLVSQNAAQAMLRNQVMLYLKAIWAKHAATANPANADADA